MNINYPNAESVPRGLNVKDIEKEIEKRNLVGLANNSKWNKLISEIRIHDDWRPSYRSKWVNGHVSGWDVEWFYHLPFPFLGVMWFDISLKSNGESVNWIIDLIKKIGFDYEINNEIVRIYGYGPRENDLFDE
jgi:hypothetical protein